MTGASWADDPHAVYVTPFWLHPWACPARVAQHDVRCRANRRCGGREGTLTGPAASSRRGMARMHNAVVVSVSATRHLNQDHHESARLMGPRPKAPPLAPTRFVEVSLALVRINYVIANMRRRRRAGGRFDYTTVRQVKLSGSYYSVDF